MHWAGRLGISVQACPPLAAQELFAAVCASKAEPPAPTPQTTRKAQIQFNRWLDMPEQERTPGHLVEMLGFDYFTLLDHLTIARSRRHVEKYYGTSETGRFPDRLPPINIKADVDRAAAIGEAADCRAFADTDDAVAGVDPH